MKRKKYLLILTCILSMMGMGCSTKEQTNNSSQTDSIIDDFGSEAIKNRVLSTSTGKIRIPYTGKRSSVIYVTSASSLPDYEELEIYDDAYFQEHALLLVTETVNSGSIDVGIQSVDVEGSSAILTLYHNKPFRSSAITEDMATWLLWLEVESGLDYQWKIANPALRNDAVAY